MTQELEEKIRNQLDTYDAEQKRIANAARYVALRKYIIDNGIVILNGKWLIAAELDARLDQMRKEQP